MLFSYAYLKCNYSFIIVNILSVQKGNYNRFFKIYYYKSYYYIEKEGLYVLLKCFFSTKKSKKMHFQGGVKWFGVKIVTIFVFQTGI